MGKQSVVPTATVSAANQQKKSADDTDGDEGWRVVLLRALVRGDIEFTSRVMHDHIDILSLPFTKSMPVWKVQWESMYWWMLRDATPIFIAAAYSHPELVHWLLLRGADRTSKCYLDRTPLDFVGECCETSMVAIPETSSSSILERSVACRRLLTVPPTLPAPPMDGVQFACHISTQVVVVSVPPTSAASAASSSSATSRSSGSGAKPGNSAAGMTQQTIYKCLVDAAWEAPLSNGAIIEKYEIRHRVLAEEGGDGSSSWRVERAAHNRKSRRQGLLIENLQFDSSYEFMIRSWNAAGKGEWGRAYKFRTLVSPDAESKAK